jgi:glutathione S-transferase
MPELTLVIGTRNYSSWSLRPWLLLRHLGLDFGERLIHLDTPEFAGEVAGVSPNRRVPVLLHGKVVVWESLAICEYVSELAGGKGWPADAADRAHARAIAAEMHAGFGALREDCPMNIRARNRRVVMTDALARDLERVGEIWTRCRLAHASRGPWLFGEYSAADAMFAPVALRILTYGLALPSGATGYQQTVLEDPQLCEWTDAAAIEGVIVAADEAGVPG